MVGLEDSVWERPGPRRPPRSDCQEGSGPERAVTTGRKPQPNGASAAARQDTRTPRGAMAEIRAGIVTLRVDYGNSSESWWQALWQRLETEPGRVPEALRRLVHPRSNDTIEVSLAEARAALDWAVRPARLGRRAPPRPESAALRARPLTGGGPGAAGGGLVAPAQEAQHVRPGEHPHQAVAVLDHRHLVVVAVGQQAQGLVQPRPGPGRLQRRAGHRLPDGGRRPGLPGHPPGVRGGDQTDQPPGAVAHRQRPPALAQDVLVDELVQSHRRGGDRRPGVHHRADGDPGDAVAELLGVARLPGGAVQEPADEGRPQAVQEAAVEQLGQPPQDEQQADGLPDVGGDARRQQPVAG